ncbi:hypothetical protein GCM10010201_19480 [Pilimelia columellifera subsp. columellifera]|uniref:Uncharacterized protein n=1 Tax=Pilimelia columellifera subsp. columellifera TaxID=706583 RepID=A0ABN3NGL9_9ACTN
MVTLAAGTIGLNAGCGIAAATSGPTLPGSAPSGIDGSRAGAGTPGAGGGRRALVDPVDLERLRGGPARPTRGVAYPFDLLTHCGIEHARFGGRTWRSERPLRQPRPLPDADGLTRHTGYTAGTMTVNDRDSATFVIDVRRADPFGSAEVVFYATRQTPPLCH